MVVVFQLVVLLLAGLLLAMGFQLTLAGLRLPMAQLVLVAVRFQVPAVPVHMELVTFQDLVVLEVNCIVLMLMHSFLLDLDPFVALAL